MSEKTLEEMFKRKELHFAVQQNDLKRVKELILDGFDVNIFDDITRGAHDVASYSCVITPI